MQGFRNIFIYIFFLIFQSVAVAQDIHFSQFYATRSYLNPAFTGIDKCSRYTLAARNQWSAIYKAYASYFFSYENTITKNLMGFGGYVASDHAGSGGLRTTIINLNYSYGFAITRKMACRFGALTGLHQKTINFNDLFFGDQIARGGNVPTIEVVPVTKAFLDIGAGGIIYTENFWFGVSSSHLNKPNEALGNSGKARLPVKTSIHGGYFIKTNDPPKKIDIRYLIPVVNFQHQNKFNELYWGGYYSRNPLNLGIWYRGIPFMDDKVNGYTSTDAVCVLVGYSGGKINVGYSYDITISQLGLGSGGAQEIVCYYMLCRKNKYKKFLGNMSCPKF